jgi:hypothetical protein
VRTLTPMPLRRILRSHMPIDFRKAIFVLHPHLTLKVNTLQSRKAAF